MTNKLQQIQLDQVLSKLEKRDAVNSHVAEIIGIMERGKTIASHLSSLLSRYAQWVQDTGRCADIFTEEELSDVQEAGEVFKQRMNALYVSIGESLPK